jgi:hypothetical protein
MQSRTSRSLQLWTGRTGRRRWCGRVRRRNELGGQVEHHCIAGIAQARLKLTGRPAVARASNVPLRPFNCT